MTQTRLPRVVALEGAERYRRLLEGPPHTAALKSGLVTLQPGESVGEHVTERKEEAIVVIRGAAQVMVAGKNVFSAHAPALVYIPPETPHDIRNEGKELLQYVYVVAPVREESLTLRRESLTPK